MSAIRAGGTGWRGRARARHRTRASTRDQSRTLPPAQPSLPTRARACPPDAPGGPQTQTTGTLRAVDRLQAPTGPRAIVRHRPQRQSAGRLQKSPSHRRCRDEDRGATRACPSPLRRRRLREPTRFRKRTTKQTLSAFAVGLPASSAAPAPRRRHH
ncbi:hypothetical protein BC828DRAFT_53924 [Blastocladiella britannica]|nr:hypothetical protein BC828DRAFT_53924 [Blastocladiella britannica]